MLTGSLRSRGVYIGGEPVLNPKTSLIKGSEDERTPKNAF